jgi:FkbM family methyltransferase
MTYYGQFDPPVDQFIYERYFIGRGTPGVSIECGAFDGLTESSCKFFEESLGWTTINVEPYPVAYERLLANRPNSVNVNVALSNVNGTADFTAVIHPQFGADCNNGSIRHTTTHKEYLDSICCQYKKYQVPTTTFVDLVSQLNLKAIDLLVLDVEGHEYEVLEGMRDAAPSSLPLVLCIEHGHLGVDQMKPAVEVLGYTFDTTSFVNSFYLRNDIAKIFDMTLGAAPSLLWMILQLKSEIALLTADNAMLRGDRYLLINSRSWKLTAPLRRLRALLSEAFSGRMR